MAGEIKKLNLLHPSEYEHPLDRQALQLLEGTPGLESLVRKYNKHYIERVLRLVYTGSNIKVNENSFPELNDIFMEVCETLHLKRIPELYIEEKSEINGFTVGSEKPVIVLTSDAIDSLTDDELRYLIGHEVGHIKSGHMVYQTIAKDLGFLGDLIGAATLGIGEIISISLELALLHWQRMSEFTADRAGLLACQNDDAVITTLMKLGGVPKKFYNRIKKDAFIEQAREFEGYDYNKLDKIGKILIASLSTHPWSVMRASEILKWIESGKYGGIIEKYSGNPSEIELSCHKCGTALVGDENFCGICGSKLWGR